MLLIGHSLGQAICCDDIVGWDRAINVAEDVARGSGLFVLLASTAAAITVAVVEKKRTIS